MNKLVKYSVATLLATGLFGMSTQTTSATTNYQRLTHNAYAYNYNGQRANHKLYKKGSKVKVIGSITLNGKKYNIISGNVYIKASNFKKARTNANADLGDGYETSLIRNSYVYNSKGQRIKGMKLRKNHSITYYGHPVRINGKKYVLIGANQYVRSCNVLLAYNGPTGSDSMNHAHHNVATSTTKRNISSNASSSSNANSSKQNNINSKTSDKQTANNSLSSNNKQSSNTNNSASSNTNNGNQPINGSLATDADYAALSQAAENAKLALNNNQSATWARRKAVYAALRPADSYTATYNQEKNHQISYQVKTTSADIQKTISDLNKAVANLDGAAERAKMPTVIFKVSVDNGLVEEPLTKAQRDQLLSVVNDINGSTDAHFMDGTNYKQVGFTDGDGITRTNYSSTYYNSKYIDANTGKEIKPMY